MPLVQTLPWFPQRQRRNYIINDYKKLLFITHHSYYFILYTSSIFIADMAELALDTCIAEDGEDKLHLSFDLLEDVSQCIISGGDSHKKSEYSPDKHLLLSMVSYHDTYA